ncbi:MAG: hypothetical protein Q4B14_02300, partial [Clostridia bacterium]|nr:hypothetical protein [Clostridia bacterium]
DEEEAADEANIVREATEQSLIVSNNSVAMPVVIGIILLILLALLVMFGKNTKLANKENPDKADDDSQKEDD